MKKAIALTLSVIFILSVFLFFPKRSEAEGADWCWDNWERCRERAFAADMGVLRMTLALSACDIGLGKCLVK
jgi:hypothetical protein